MVKNRTLIVIFVLFMSVVIILMGLFVYNRNQRLTDVIEKDKHVKVVEGKTQDDNKNVDKTEIFINSKGEEFKMDSREKQDIRIVDIINIKSSLENNIYNFNFLEAHEFIHEETLKFNKDSIPEDIMLSLEETATMSNFKGMIDYGENEAVISMIKELKDVDNFLVSTLYLDHNDRRYIIESTNSINPIFFGGIEKVNKEDITDRYKEENINELNFIKNIEKVYKHEFKIEGNTIFSYTVKADGKLRFVKMVPDKDNLIQYYTIKEWDKLFN